MSAIKELPTTFREYYTSMKNAYTYKKEEVEDKLKTTTQEELELYNEIKDRYKLDDSIDFNLNSYPEFVDNEYTTGQFLRAAKGYFINKSENYELVGAKYDIYNLAKLQKDVYSLKKELELINKLLNLSLKEYSKVLETYYNKVHEKLVCDGYGYVFDNNIGWICFNRCKLSSNHKPTIDYAKTNARKKEFIAAGKKIYNREEAEWCKQNGIEYKYEDYRVMQDVEYVYDIKLLGCKLPNGSSYNFYVTNRDARSLRGKSNEEIIELTHGDKKEICQLGFDVKHKLDLCLLVDPLLYTKFIRNENQKSSNYRAFDRKNRQRL